LSHGNTLKRPINSHDAVEIDQAFASRDAWKVWAGNNPEVYDDTTGATVAEGIQNEGFVKPLTGRFVSPSEIITPDSNWREGLIANGLNSRMRAVLDLLSQEVADRNRFDLRLFAAEAFSPIAMLLRGLFPKFIGSEYAMDDSVRRHLYPVQHQDLTKLSLPSDCFDIVTTNEVLEHVSDIDAALHEVARVLRPGGVHIGTFPFLFEYEEGDMRARLSEQQVVYLKEPEYHGNPLDLAGGSLVFETPGWNIIQRAHLAGFGSAQMRFVASEKHGYTTDNTGIILFVARR
jgi:SAM-dependent methyltransferase